MNNNGKVFEPHNQIISDVFSCQAIYSIPNYHRQYSWVYRTIRGVVK